MPTTTVHHFPPFTRVRRSYNSSGTLTQTLSTPVNQSNGFHPRQKRDYKTWNRTVNYKQVRKSQGYLNTLNYTNEKIHVRGELFSGTFRVSNPASQERVEVSDCNLTPPQYVTSCEGATVRNADASKLLAECQYKVLSAARDLKVSLPVFFGEGRQTVKMLQDSASTLYRAYKHFRRGRFKRVLKELNLNKPFVTDKIAANNWLAYQYGWRPLLGDMVNSATLLYDVLNDNAKWGVRRRITRSMAAPLKRGTYSIANVLVQGYTDETEWERTMVARAGLLLEIESSTAALAAQLGVGLTDPILTLWELTPFSFVFDWLVDVGGWLEARSSLQGLRVLDGFTGVYSSYLGVTQMKYTSWIFPKRDSYPVWRVLNRHYERKTWNGAVYTIRTPLWDGLNANRLTTAASLFAQRLSGDRKPSDPYPISPFRKRNFGRG